MFEAVLILAVGVVALFARRHAILYPRSWWELCYEPAGQGLQVLGKFYGTEDEAIEASRIRSLNWLWQRSDERVSHVQIGRYSIRPVETPTAS